MTKYDEAFKRRVVQEYLSGGAGTQALSRKYGMGCSVLKRWIRAWRDIARLCGLLALIEDATGFIDRSMRDDLQAVSWRKRLDFLLSERGLQRYRCRKHVPDPAVLTPVEFRYRFTQIGRNNQPVRIRRARSGGLFVPD